MPALTEGLAPRLAPIARLVAWAAAIPLLRPLAPWTAVHVVGLLALTVFQSHVTTGAPPKIVRSVEVTFGGCEVLRVDRDDDHPDGIVCELWGTSLLEGARGGSPARSATDPETITLWTSTPDTDLAVAVDGVFQRDVRWVSLADVGDEGRRAKVTLWQPVHEVTVHAAGAQIFRLPIVAAKDEKGERLLREAVDQRYRDAERARTIALRLVRDGGVSVQAKALALLGRMEISTDTDAALRHLDAAIAADRALGRLSGEVNDVIAHAWTRMNKRPELELAAEELDDLDARGVLDAFPEGRALVPYYRAMIASFRGDAYRAYRYSADAERRVRRLDMQGQLAAVHQHQVTLLASFGDSGDQDEDEAAKRLREEPPPADRPCAVANFYNGLGFRALDAADHAQNPEGEHARADALLESAEIQFDAGRCPDACERQNVLINRAHNALDWARARREAGRTREEAEILENAERHLADAAPLCPRGPVHQRAEWSVHAGRLALQRGRPAEAEALFDEAVRWSRLGSLPYYEVEALLGLAEAAEATDEERALQRYREAEERLDRWSEAASADGRRAFFARYSASVRRYLDLLARRLDSLSLSDEERHEGILRLACAARRSMARVLSASDRTFRLAHSPERSRPGPLRDAFLALEKERAQIEDEARGLAGQSDASSKARLEALVERAADASARMDRVLAEIAGPASAPPPACEGPSPPAPPGPEEAVLVYHPVAGSAWLGIFLSADAAQIHRFQIDPRALRRMEVEVSENAEPSAVPSTLATLLLDPFAELLAAREGSRIRIHAAEPVGSFDLGPALESRFVVTHGVDLPPRDDARRRWRRALVVTPDPDERTPESSVRAKQLEDALPGFEVVSLSGAQATRDHLQEELDRGVDILVVYAHGLRDRRPNRDGWATRVELHGTSWLSAGDALMLRGVPPIVLLVNCGGAVTRGHSYVQGPSLAHALLLAGAEQVLASPRVLLQSGDASWMFGALRELRGAIADDPPMALHRLAVERAHARSPLPPLLLDVLSR